MDSHMTIKDTEIMCKAALDQLILKDEIIEDLQNQLLKERSDNSNLRKKCEELESKIGLIESNLNDDNSQSQSIIKSKKAGARTTTDENTVENIKFFNSTNFNQYQNQSTEIIKMIDDKNEYKSKYESLEIEFNNFKEKVKNLAEIEDIYRHQIEQQKKRIESLEKQSAQFRERECYIDELINRYNNLEKDYELLLANKQNEIRELTGQLSIQKNINERSQTQLNSLSQNSNSFSQELIKEIRGLEEKNKDLEMNLYKMEMIYKEEIKKLQRLLTDNEIASQKEQSQSGSNVLKVEDLATSLTKSIREKIDSQNKKISSQNVELISLQYELEKTNSEMKYERELNEKLQKMLAHHKYNSMNINNEKEEAQVQTIIKMDDIDSTKMKVKILEENLSKLTEKTEQIEKSYKNLHEKYSKLHKSNVEKEIQIQILMKKIDKHSKGDKLIDKEALNAINNVSNLNMTISALKARENELKERLQDLEKELVDIDRSRDRIVQKHEHTDNKNIKLSSNMQSLSFNISQDSSSNLVNNSSAMNCKMYPNTAIPNEIHQFQEDNFFLREQNFKLISDLNRLHENLNNYKVNYQNLTLEKEQLIEERHSQCIKYEDIIRELSNQLEKCKQINSGNIEEMRFKLNNFSDVNFKMNEQFVSLQNKFYVQTQLIQDKNLELQNLKRSYDLLLNEKDELILKKEKIEEELKTHEHSYKTTKNDLDKYRKELSECKTAFSEQISKLNFERNEFEERNRILVSENENSNKITKKIKLKLDDMYEESKEKERKLTNLLKEEIKENEMRFMGELQELREENENFIKERSGLRLMINDLKYELGLAQDQLTQNQFNRSNTSLNCSSNGIVPTTAFMSMSKKFNGTGNNSKSNNKHIANSNTTKFEAEISHLREENKTLKNDLEHISNGLAFTEKALRDAKSNLQTADSENKRLLELVRTRESELKFVESDLQCLKLNVKKLQSNEEISQLLNEISSKNQTINYLIDEVEKVKKEAKENLSQVETIKKKLQEENENLQKSLKSISLEHNNLKKSSEELANDLKSENEILIADLEQKELEINELKKEKLKVENEFEDTSKNNAEYNEKIVSEIKIKNEETSKLQNELQSFAKDSTDKFTALKEKIKKSKIKIDELVKVYEAHIKFLGERFNSILYSFTLICDTKKNTQYKDFNEKFMKLLKQIENSVDLVTKISHREAIIDNLDSELKTLKSSSTNQQNTIKKLQKEKEDLNEIINIKKLQMKIKNSQQKANYINYMNLESLSHELAESKLKINNNKVKMKKISSEIKLITEKNNFLTEKNENYSEKISILEEELNKKEKEFNDANKSHKTEIFKILDELKNIKEKWAPPQKINEYISTIDDLEKQIKNLKDDVNRKRELITTMKKQNDIKNKDSSFLEGSSSGNINNVNNPFSQTQNEEKEKIKLLNKENSRKDNIIKDLRINLDSIKTNEKKLIEENNSLMEKIKISKIDIGRKENIIKEFKEKFKENSNSDIESESIQKLNDDLKENVKKLKSEVERKDGIIRSFKAKLETVGLEIDQLRNLNLKLSKNNYSEVEKEQKQCESIRIKLDQLSFRNENLLSLVRRIFKDLISTYERIKSRTTIANTSKGLKEGLDILGVSQDELIEYISPAEKIELYDRVNTLLEANTIEAETFMKIYSSLKEKIMNLDRTNTFNLNTDYKDNIFNTYTK